MASGVLKGNSFNVLCNHVEQEAANFTTQQVKVVLFGFASKMQKLNGPKRILNF